MTVIAPLIDRRTLADVERQILGDPGVPLSGLRGTYTPEWTSTREREIGHALYALFARLLLVVTDRLNRSPEMHFFRFLDLLGIERLAGNAARTPVKFLLPPGNRTGGTVEAGTQVATGASPGTGTVHVFETERGLFVTPVPLERLLTLQPQLDRFAARAAIAGASVADGGELLLVDTPIEHSLYFAHDTLFAAGVPAELIVAVTVTFPLPNPPTPAQWTVVWQRFTVDATGQGSWQDMAPTIAAPSPLAPQLLESGFFTFQDFPGTAPSAPAGLPTANWIRATLATPLPPDGALPFTIPTLEALEISRSIDRLDLALDAAFFNSAAIDLTRDFQPFGTQPRLADTFYLASADVFSREGASVTLAVEPSSGVPAATPSTDLRLVWEAWNGTAWEEVTLLNDETDRFAAASSSPPTVIGFRLPTTLGQTTVAGLQSYWIRVRIVEGNYGQPAHYEPVPGSSPVEYVFVPDSIVAPSLARITASYTQQTQPVLPQRVATFNHFEARDRLAELQAATPFPPFDPIPESSPALYLGFPTAFGTRAISVFFEVAEEPDSIDTPLTSPDRVIWEYSVGLDVWQRLAIIDDGTEQLTTPGSLVFLAAADQGRTSRFGHDLFWIRARFAAAPRGLRLNAVHLNTVMAADAVTIRGEVLGAGNGRPGQTASFSQVPVLPGERIYVREPEVPDAPALDALERDEERELRRALLPTERADLVRVVENALTGEREVWVRWHRVSNFQISGPSSRHYTLDAPLGVVVFGDGTAGLLPPILRDNIQAVIYRAGGGALANREVLAGTVRELRSFHPAVDKVTNVLDAAGGSDTESILAVLERGPQTIRNRDRAVTLDDFVWLARQASTEVHAARCLPTTNGQLQFQPGAVAVLIVPKSERARPRPSQELRRRVRTYIVERAFLEIADNIFVLPPQYVTVTVHARIVAVEPEASSEIEQQAREAMNTFLHPVTGGPSGGGWEFGRNVYVSEIHELLENIQGVDVVEEVFLNGDPTLAEVPVGDNELPAAGNHRIVMTLAP